MSTTDKVEAIRELRKACRCLFIQIPAEIAADVQAKAETVIGLLSQQGEPEPSCGKQSDNYAAARDAAQQKK